MKRLNGRDMLLFMEQTPNVYINFEGLKTSGFEFVASEIISNANNSTKKWRELLVPAHKKHMVIWGQGLFKNRASDVEFRDLFFADKAVKLKVIILGFAEIVGEFQISNIKYLAAHDVELSFEFKLQSAGFVTVNTL